ncbi:unnamed protein product [Toxocara canis]|uniref:Uncharacterized protein n=1 Tax=Toxocara canis TaxID=6265 RepID=A0A183U2H6_TOXCA|nr:unnamed protein product [Toxocara canis]
MSQRLMLQPNSELHWESTHSPVAVAQVTPMMAAPHSNAGAEQVPQGPLAETVPQQQQHSMPQTAPVAQPPSLSSAVAGANVARVGPISSQPVEPQVASMPCVPPTQQQNISADDSQQLTQSVVLQQTSAEVTPSTGSVTAVEAGSTSISVSSVVSAVGTSTTAQSAPLTLHNSIDAQHESTILGRQGNESSAAVATAQSGNAGRLGTSHVTRSITVEAIKQERQEILVVGRATRNTLKDVGGDSGYR